MNSYNYEEKSITIPLDHRLGIALMYLAALVLLVVDTFDGESGIVGRWAIVIAVGGCAWTCVALHSYSRRVLLEVMSWEHRQQMFGADAGNSLALVRDRDEAAEGTL